MLADAAISAQFLTAKDTSVLIQKLRRQVGKTAGKLIGQGVDATQISNKTDDNTVKLNIDLCMRAISIDRKIRFQYADTLLTKDVVYRHAGRSSIISPYTLVWSEKRYFLIGCTAGYEGVSVYRLDRMIKPELLDSKRKPLPEALGCLPGQDPDLMLQQYLQQMFNMYGGEKIELHLICRGSAADDILLQFGSVSNVK